MVGEAENERKKSPAGCMLNKIKPSDRVKLKYCSIHLRSNKNGDNDSTNLSDISHGTFESETLKVFIRKSQKERMKVGDLEAIRDLAALRQRPNLHENFIRYFAMEDDENFIYVITEWCICSVEDLYGNRSNEGTNWIGEQIFVGKIKESLGPKQILWQATKGLEYLHHLKYVHRNLKPSNFLIAQISDTDQPDEYKVKLSDFSYSKQPEKSPIVSGQRGSNGWIAPISETGTIKALEDYVADDVFVLGCFFHYVLTNGLHPFGNNPLRINSNSDSVYCAAWNPSLQKQNEQADFLLKQMIKFNPKERYNPIQVLDSHYFLPDEDYYKLYDIPGGIKPGLCVIFNQEIFDNPSRNRKGTEQDKKKLTNIFKDLGFDVEIFENLKKKDLLYYIEGLTLRDFSTYASLIVCILSHGNENVVEGIDGKSLNINDLKYKFNGNDCPSLNEKLKIWIIQACQGTKNQEPLRPFSYKKSTSRSNFSTDSNEPLRQIPRFQMSYEQKITFEGRPVTTTEANRSTQKKVNNRAPLMDFLDIRASIPGFCSYRSEDEGSNLIQCLCDELKKEYLSGKTSPNKESKDLEGILNSVQDIISKKTMTLSENSEIEFVKQTIVRNVSLDRRIKFKKSHLPGVETLRQNDRDVGLFSRLCRFIFFVSAPPHRCFYQSWDEVFDREVHQFHLPNFLIYLIFGGITLSALSHFFKR